MHAIRIGPPGRMQFHIHALHADPALSLQAPAAKPAAAPKPAAKPAAPKKAAAPAAAAAQPAAPRIAPPAQLQAPAVLPGGESLTFTASPNSSRAKAYLRNDFSHNSFEAMKISADNNKLCKRVSQGRAWHAVCLTLWLGQRDGQMAALGRYSAAAEVQEGGGV